MKITTPYITLQQLLKLEGIVSSGGIVKAFLLEEKVYVNQERETRRGRKLYPGDHVTYDDYDLWIEAEEHHES